MKENISMLVIYLLTGFSLNNSDMSTTAASAISSRAPKFFAGTEGELPEGYFSELAAEQVSGVALLTQTNYTYLLILHCY